MRYVCKHLTGPLSGRFIGPIICLFESRMVWCMHARMVLKQRSADLWLLFSKFACLFITFNINIYFDFVECGGLGSCF